MDFRELPTGFGIMLAENQVALNVYSALPEKDKQKVSAKAKKAVTAEEMHSIISSLATKGGLG